MVGRLLVHGAWDPNRIRTPPRHRFEGKQHHPRRLRPLIATPSLPFRCGLSSFYQNFTSDLERPLCAAQ